MRGLLFACFDAAVAAILLGPIFGHLNKKIYRNGPRTLCYFLFAVYLCGMFAIVGLPDIGYIRFQPRFNFIPFAYMFSAFTSSFLNVLLFVPLGFFLPLLWQGFRSLGKTFLFGFSVSLFIEIGQIFTYRASDINDLMTNSFGAVIGWGLSRLLLCRSCGISPVRTCNDLWHICTVSFLIMVFVHPFAANLIFHVLAQPLFL